MSITSICLSIWLSIVADCPGVIIVLSLLGLIAFVSLLFVSKNPQRYTMIRITSVSVEVTNPRTKKKECVLWENVTKIEHQIQVHYGLEWYVVMYRDPTFPEECEHFQKILRLPLYGIEKNKIGAFIPEGIGISRYS